MARSSKMKVGRTRTKKDRTSDTKRDRISDTKRDRISEMPSDIQETILCYLPIRDAARTSILSKNWRYSWTMISQLVFDDQFLSSMMIKLSQNHDNSELRNTWEKYSQKAHKIVSVIDKVLQLHDGPILKFSLRFSEHCDTQTISDLIGQRILLFSRKGIKQLILEMPSYGEIMAHDISSLDLTHLRLGRVWFRSTLASGEFTYLINLQLFNATYYGKGIYNCPVLEKLTLKYCRGLSLINFHAPNLRCMHETSGEITLSYLENLKEYSFGLTEFWWPTDTKTSNLVKVLGSLHNIEYFSIRILFIKYLAVGGCPDTLPNPVPCLKSLNIYDINFTQPSEVFCLLCLIRSAPKLCKLHISVNRVEKEAVEGDLEDYWVKVSEDCTIDRLEFVTFSKLQGLRTELDVIKFILAHSPLLKKMFIHYSPRALEKNIAAKMTKEMLQYYRTSSRVQIIHLGKRP